MVEINFLNVEYPGATISIELDIAYTSSTELYTNFDIIELKDIQFGSDDDEDEKVVFPSGFDLEFRVSPQTNQIHRKIYNLLTIYTTDVLFKKNGNTFFKGVVDRRSVKMEIEDFTIKIKVDDLIQSYKNRDITGNPFGINISGSGINNPTYPIRYLLLTYANNNHGTPFYTDFVTDSELKSIYSYDTYEYEVNLAGLNNYADPDNLVYYAVWNQFYTNNPLSESPKTLTEVIKYLVNILGCVCVPGYEGKLFVLQRWKNTTKAAAAITLDETVILESDIKIIPAKEGVTNKNGLIRMVPSISVTPHDVDRGNILRRSGSVLKNTETETYESFVVDAPYSDSGNDYTGLYATWNRAGYPNDVRYNLHQDILADSTTADGVTYGTVSDVVADNIYNLVSQYRTNFIVKVAGINYNLDDYYKLSVDWPPSGRVYRCRKISYNFPENYTELNLVSL